MSWNRLLLCRLWPWHLLGYLFCLVSVVILGYCFWNGFGEVAYGILGFMVMLYTIHIMFMTIRCGRRMLNAPLFEPRILCSVKLLSAVFCAQVYEIFAGLLYENWGLVIIGWAILFFILMIMGKMIGRISYIRRSLNFRKM
jgi:hypothetical protein